MTRAGEIAHIDVILGGPEGAQALSLFINLLLCKCIYFSFTNLRPECDPRMCDTATQTDKYMTQIEDILVQARESITELEKRLRE